MRAPLLARPRSWAGERLNGAVVGRRMLGRRPTPGDHEPASSPQIDASAGHGCLP